VNSGAEHRRRQRPFIDLGVTVIVQPVADLQAGSHVTFTRAPLTGITAFQPCPALPGI
jgi:hypothetical protein